MTASEFNKKLADKTLIVLDLQSGAEYEATLSLSGERKLKKAKDVSPKTLTNTAYQGRAST